MPARRQWQSVNTSMSKVSKILQVAVWFSRPVILAVAISSGALLAQPVRLPHQIDNARTATLQGSLHPRAQARYDRGSEDPSRNLPFITLMLKPSAAQRAALERLLEEQQDRSSPQYHKWLTPGQFGDRFGLAPSDYSMVSAWLESQGLHIEQKARARNFVTISGAVERVDHAFHTHIHRYRIDGQTYFANATELSLPAARPNPALRYRLGCESTGPRGLGHHLRCHAALRHGNRRRRTADRHRGRLRHEPGGHRQLSQAGRIAAEPGGAALGGARSRPPRHPQRSGPRSRMGGRHRAQSNPRLYLRPQLQHCSAGGD